MLDVTLLLARNKKPVSQQTPSKRFWTDSVSPPLLNPALIDPNIENISANVNRADSDRILSQKLADNYYSSDESNDSLVIYHD